MKRFVIILVIFASLVGIGIYVSRRKATSRDDMNQGNKTAVTEMGPITSKVSATGLIAANLIVDIKCKAGGEIIYLPFEPGDRVKKGDILFKIDPVYEKQNVEKAEAALQLARAQQIQANQNLIIAEKTLKVNREKAQVALALAEANARDARTKADRLKQLLEKKLVSQEEYDTAEILAIQAQTNLENAKIRLKELEIDELSLELRRQDVKLADVKVLAATIDLSDAKQRLNDTVGISPIDGVVTEKRVQIGQIISSSLTNVGGGTSIMEISDVSRLFAITSIDESDAGKVRVGQEARITVDAYPEERFFGKVVQVAPKGTISSNVVTFDVKVEITSRNKALLKQNMTANVDIIISHRDEAVLVPIEAIIRRGKDKFVNVLLNGRTEERKVQTGVDDGVKVEVTDGLKVGEVVVLKGTVKTEWENKRGRMSIRVGPVGRRL